MKVLNLACENRHSFEGWFASEDDFQSQLARGLVECPICADPRITKLLSAPRLNLGAASVPPAASAAPAQRSAPTSPGPVRDAGLQAAWLRTMREIVANTENVGERFAEEARRIHYGEADARSIRGQASKKDTEALLEEGISVLPLPPVFEPPEH